MKKILSLVLVIVFVLSCSFVLNVSAATSVSIGEITSDYTLTDVSIPYTVTGGVETDQITMLVYNSAGGVVASETNIVYIDQISHQATGTFDFKMKDGSPNGVYTVLMGGTNIATAASKNFTYGPVIMPTSYTVTGEVNCYANNVTNVSSKLSQWNANSDKGFFITLKNAAQTTVIKTATLTYNTGKIANFTFTNVAPGSYVIQIYRIGTIARCFPITLGEQTTETVDVGQKHLFLGDVRTGFGTINAQDLIQIKGSIGKNVSFTDYNIYNDVDLNGNINAQDALQSITNVGKNVTFYGEAAVPIPNDYVTPAPVATPAA